MKNSFNAILDEKLRTKKVLIASHRGLNGGNIIENTVNAYKNALFHNADIMEVDGVLSTDGVWYAYHDGYEPFHFKVDKNMNKMSSAEIDKLTFINRYHVRVKQGVEKLEYVLSFLKDKDCIVNIDRCFKNFPLVIDLVRSLKMENKVIIKTFAEDDLLSLFYKTNPDIMFMPILGKEEEIARLEKYDLNYCGCELVFSSLENPLVSPQNMKYLKDKYKILWVNPLSCEDDLILSGGLDDNLSVTENPDLGWGRLVDMGFNLIQTDWPLALDRYLKERGNRF